MGYVVQGVLRYAKEQATSCIREVLAQNLCQIGQSVHGCAVLRAALREGPRDQQVTFARSLAKESEVLSTIARSRIGHMVVLHALRLLPSPEDEVMIAEMLEGAHIFSNTKSGRALLDLLSTSGTVVERSKLVRTYLARIDKA